MTYKRCVHRFLLIISLSTYLVTLSILLSVSFCFYILIYINYISNRFNIKMASKILIAIVLVVAMFALISETQAGRE